MVRIGAELVRKPPIICVCHSLPPGNVIAVAGILEGRDEAMKLLDMISQYGLLILIELSIVAWCSDCRSLVQAMPCHGLLLVLSGD